MLQLSDFAPPQGLVDFASGYGSYYGGLANAATHGWRRAGFSGDCEKQRALEEEEILGAAVRAFSVPGVAPEVAAKATSWAASHKAYVAGRFSAGAITGALTGLGPAGGVSLGVLAATGDALDAVRRGADNPEQILRAVLGDKAPSIPAGARTKCKCSK